MARHKLSIASFCDYKLIAIHTPLEDYRLVYMLNGALSLQLAKRYDKECFAVDGGKGGGFSYYHWENKLLQIDWHCVANKLVCEEETEGMLFGKTSIIHYLIEDKKKVDYFLKIDTEGRLDMQGILTAIKGLPYVSMAYTIKTEGLNVKHKLLFQEC